VVSHSIRKVAFELQHQGGRNQEEREWHNKIIRRFKLKPLFPKTLCIFNFLKILKSRKRMYEVMTITREVSVDTISIAKSIFMATLAPWLSRLYFNGPSLFGYGFWEGRRKTEICDEISGRALGPRFWEGNNQVECEFLLGRKLNAFYILISSWICLICFFTIIKII
jgi:hypothetical protein